MNAQSVRCTVPFHRWARVKAQVEDANRRAVRHGWPLITLEHNREHWIETDAYPLGVRVVDFTVTVAPMSFAGWRFVAVLEPMEGGNLVKSVPGEVCPERYRTAPMTCDHCRTDRQRKATYVLAHDDGRYAQVGSNCLQDFLGDAGADVLTYIGHLEALLYLVRQAAEAGVDDAARPQRVEEAATLPFLAAVVWAIETYGWRSRKRALAEGGTTTVQVVLDHLEDKERRGAMAITDAHRAKAQAVLDWLRSNAAEAACPGRGQYAWNLYLLASGDGVERANMGLLASGVALYDQVQERQRQQQQAAAANAYIGQVGDRLNVTLVIDGVRSIQGHYGVVRLISMHDAQGRQAIWWCSAAGQFEPGQTVTGQVTVKGHEINQYTRQPQTVLTRCKLVPAAGTTLFDKAHA